MSLLLPLLMNLGMFGGVTPPTPTPEVPAPRGGGGRWSGKRPRYWWEAAYEDLRKIPLPAESERADEALEVLADLQSLWQELDARELHFRRQLAEVDRLERRVAEVLESRRIVQLLEETKQRIWAAEEARKARRAIEEENELVELLAVEDW